MDLSNLHPEVIRATHLVESVLPEFLPDLKKLGEDEHCILSLSQNIKSRTWGLFRDAIGVPEGRGATCILERKILREGLNLVGAKFSIPEVTLDQPGVISVILFDDENGMPRGAVMLLSEQGVRENLN